jgi:hypothetical protein
MGAPKNHDLLLRKVQSSKNCRAGTARRGAFHCLRVSSRLMRDCSENVAARFSLRPKGTSSPFPYKKARGQYYIFLVLGVSMEHEWLVLNKLTISLLKIHAVSESSAKNLDAQVAPAGRGPGHTGVAAPMPPRYWPLNPYSGVIYSLTIFSMDSYNCRRFRRMPPRVRGRVESKPG